MRRAIFHIIAIVSAMILCFNVYGDIMPARGVGKTIQPRHDVPIRMLSEVVDVFISNDVAGVHCRFTLENHGFSDTLEVGFPRGAQEKELYDMDVKVDGHRVPVTEKKLKEPNTETDIFYWTTFPVPCYHKGPKMIVLVNYTMILFRGDKEFFSDLPFKYILKTGSFWEGTIGDALITVRIQNTNPEQLAVISPEGYQRENNVIIWHFTDFEPDKDIEIRIVQDVVFDCKEEAKRLLSMLSRIIM